MSKLDFKKELVGNFGYPVWENPTEAMVQAAFDHHNLAFRYVTTEVKPKNLKSAFEGVKAMGYKGFNCTLPHKVAIMSHLDGLGDSARLIEAVNCVVERDGLYIGENTDGKGFIESLSTMITPEGKKIVLFGAGGAARAVAIELALAGVESIMIVNRSEPRAQQLHKLLSDKTSVSTKTSALTESYRIVEDCDIVINCTNVGLYPDVDQCLPLDFDTLQPHMLVCDLIPNPPLTSLLRRAQLRGCQTLDGLGMLVNQGVLGIKYWTGVEVDPQIMRAKLESLFTA